MNLKEMNKPISAGEFSNNVQSAFGVKVDISKLDLDHTQKLLLTVNEEIKKQRLSEDRHSLHKSKSYLAKVFIRENLQKHLEELQEAKPDFLDLDKDGNKEEPMKDAAKDAKKDDKEEAPKGLTAKQKKLPVGLQKAIAKKNESTEAQISEKLRKLYESQEDQAELLLASKDVVDRIQKAVDDLSKLRNEDLPPLLDAMRDELGSQMSEAYANIAIPTLDQLVQQLGGGRETLSQASRIITGEEAPAEQMGAELPAEEPVEELPAEEEFATADVASGAEEPEGREERE